MKWLAALLLAVSQAFAQPVINCTDAPCTFVSDPFPPGGPPDSCRLYANGTLRDEGPLAPLGAGFVCELFEAFPHGTFVAAYLTALSNGVESPPSNVITFQSVSAGPVLPVPTGLQIVSGVPSMTFALRSYTAPGFQGPSATASYSITAPSGIANGDLLLIWGFINDDDFPGTNLATASTPTGFTLVSGYPQYASTVHSAPSTGGKRNIYLWYKTAASESGNYTVNFNGSSSRFVSEFLMMAYQTAGAVTVSSSGLNLGASTTATGLSITTTQNNSIVLMLTAGWLDVSNRPAVPSGSTPTFTEVYYNYTAIIASDGPLATAGATGNKTQDSNVSISGWEWGSTLVAIQPAPAAAGNPYYFYAQQRRQSH